ncbi:MAG: hypothetical protein ACK47B_28330 [Armatimonadota bacterium]
MRKFLRSLRGGLQSSLPGAYSALPVEQQVTVSVPVLLCDFLRQMVQQELVHPFEPILRDPHLRDPRGNRRPGALTPAQREVLVAEALLALLRCGDAPPQFRVGSQTLAAGAVIDVVGALVLADLRDRRSGVAGSLVPARCGYSTDANEAGQELLRQWMQVLGQVDPVLIRALRGAGFFEAWDRLAVGLLRGAAAGVGRASRDETLERFARLFPQLSEAQASYLRELIAVAEGHASARMEAEPPSPPSPPVPRLIGPTEFLPDGTARLHADTECSHAPMQHLAHVSLPDLLSLWSQEGPDDYRVVLEEYLKASTDELLALHEGWCRGTLTREQADRYRFKQRRWAWGFLAYLGEGIAPISTLRESFASMREGKRLEIPDMPDEVRALYASMLGAEMPERLRGPDAVALVAIRLRWLAILEQLRQQRLHRNPATLVACVADALPHSFEKDTLTLQFPSKAMEELFHARGVRFSIPVSAAILEVTGIPCAVTVNGSGDSRVTLPRPTCPPRAPKRAT